MTDLGPTHYNWHPEVRAVIDGLIRYLPAVTANTYVGHPWPNWDRFSVDFWGARGRGHAIPLDTGLLLVRHLLAASGPPLVRHIIFRHRLWTSWGGWSYWSPHDHSGKLRHVHVTYWPL